MGQKRSRGTNGAWRLLRIALLWARKGGILKCRLMAELRHVPKHLKALHRHSSVGRHRRLDSGAVYGERELSFDETPILRLGMSRPGSLRFKLPNIPCIRPSVVDFDYDFGDEDEIYERKTSLLESEIVDEDEDCEYECWDYDADLGEEESIEEGIDEKADEFIARFYRQMKMQRQVSYLEYQEMLSRGAS